MGMTKNLRITIAEPSEVIRIGLESMLKRLTQYKITINNVKEDFSELTADAQVAASDLYILSPLLCGMHMENILLPEGAKTLAIVGQNYNASLFRFYGGVLNIFALTSEELQEQIEILMHTPQLEDGSLAADPESLTPREREIIICVVKGMTNKEIAQQLFLSAHTVITHRRNISKKLQIHSASGLTIYAIVNKLVALEEINL